MNLPAKTLAAILVEQNKDLVLAEINLPSTLDVGQVMVEFHYSGICGSQLGEIDGVKGPGCPICSGTRPAARSWPLARA